MTICVRALTLAIHVAISLVTLVRFTILLHWFKINPQTATNVLVVDEKSRLRPDVYPEKNYLLGMINWK